ncbi:MAG: hypothetical protein WCT03_12550 [Candidatus Obscuribacterales bacterium]|jgi:hypothetical protein
MPLTMIKNITAIACALSVFLAQPVCALERIQSTNSETGLGSAIPLTPGAKEAAQLLGLMPYVQKLYELKATHNSEPGVMSDEQLALRVQLLDKILEQSLEVRVVADRIDRELAWTYTGKGMLEGQRQKRLNYLFTANFMQGGILGVLSGPQFLSHHPNTGGELLLVASSVGLLLSSLSLVASRSGTKKMDGEQTVLADVYSLNQSGSNPLTPGEHDPVVVMKFLNSVPPNSIERKTRKEALIEAWKKGKYLRDHSETHLNKLAVVTPPGTKYREDIKLLGDRIRMLYDVQWTIEQLDSELLELMRATN